MTYCPAAVNLYCEPCASATGLVPLLSAANEILCVCSAGAAPTSLGFNSAPIVTWPVASLPTLTAAAVASV